QVLWGFICRYNPGVTPENAPALARLVHHAVRYYQDFVKPNKSFRPADEIERAALEALDREFAALPSDADAESIQARVYEVGRGFPRYQNPDRPGADGRPGVSLAWFSTLYQLLLGQEKGPRFGSFVALYGVEETRALIAKCLAGELARAEAV
ncbi:MAG TPA: lysine--tRNA ligase, partial [Afifellaceae bacterium]|nr:lysine--tRNA ligase [Afifellaceae bacterium]